MPTALKPLYTRHNCHPAYQLDWTLSAFWKGDATRDDFCGALGDAIRGDGIHLLNHRFAEPRVSQFLLSTHPDIAPQKIVQRVKGRLQYVLRSTLPSAFQRNYAIRSVGSTKRAQLEHYVENQPQHHAMADPRVQERIENLQFSDSKVDLGQPRFTSYGQYWYNLHVVLVNEGRWREIGTERLTAIREMIAKVARVRGHLLARAGILPDHVHIVLGCQFHEAPVDVGLGYMNNLAYVYGMKPVFQNGFFVGTVGEYDLGAIAQERGSAGARERDKGI